MELTNQFPNLDGWHARHLRLRRGIPSWPVWIIAALALSLTFVPLSYCTTLSRSYPSFRRLSSHVCTATSTHIWRLAARFVFPQAHHRTVHHPCNSATNSWLTRLSTATQANLRRPAEIWWCNRDPAWSPAFRCQASPGYLQLHIFLRLRTDIFTSASCHHSLPGISSIVQRPIPNLVDLFSTLCLGRGQAQLS